LSESANPHEIKCAPAPLELVDEMPPIIVADRGYDYNLLRDHVDERGSGRHYRQRWRVERLFSWLAGFRRFATRWEADPLNYGTWLYLAVSLIYVRHGLWP
jgi:Transposase DDE domain